MSVKGLFYIEALVSSLERSKSFYGTTLGWKLNTDLPEVAGVPVSEIGNKPWGERKFTFTDPDGYTWAYGQQARHIPAYLRFRHRHRKARGQACLT